jgi:hypothetical protein
MVIGHLYQEDVMPQLSFRNDEYEWVAVSLKWGMNTKNFTLAVDSNTQLVDTQGAPVWYAWTPENNVITDNQFTEYCVELVDDAAIVYGNPLEGRVPVTP